MVDEDDADVSGPTSSRRSDRNGQIRVIARMSNRRSWSATMKLAILDEAFGPDGSVSRTAERHEIGTGQIYTWRRLMRNGALSAPRPGPAFARVEVAEAPSASITPRVGAVRSDEASLETARGAPSVSCLIEIALPTGVRVRVNGGVDTKALKRVLDALGAR